MEDFKTYIHCKFETIGESNVMSVFYNVYKEEKIFKDGFEHLEKLKVVQYIFYHEYENEEWTRIILSRVHDNMFWIGDEPVKITSDLIH